MLLVIRVWQQCGARIQCVSAVCSAFRLSETFSVVTLRTRLLNTFIPSGPGDLGSNNLGYSLTRWPMCSWPPCRRPATCCCGAVFASPRRAPRPLGTIPRVDAAPPRRRVVRVAPRGALQTFPGPSPTASPATFLFATISPVAANQNGTLLLHGLLPFVRRPVSPSVLAVRFRRFPPLFGCVASVSTMSLVTIR